MYVVKAAVMPGTGSPVKRLKKSLHRVMTAMRSLVDEKGLGPSKVVVNLLLRA